MHARNHPSDRRRLSCAVAVLSVAATVLPGCSSHHKKSTIAAQEAVVEIAAAGDASLLWVDARTLTIEGRGWSDGLGAAYERLPLEAQDAVPPQVWALSKNTAGIAVRFITDSARIAARWDGGAAMNHMAATGNSGLDLYRRTGAGWEFCGVGRPDAERTTRVIATALPSTPTEYLLYLPLYHAVTLLEIGVDRGAKLVAAPDRPAERKPIVFYGTSITQGGCASRAGMCHPAILGRWLDREVINLGFSGAGKMEPAMAELLGELDPAVYVLECLPNMTPDMVRERVQPFVRFLRASHHWTPIILVENPYNPDSNPGNVALRDAFALLQAEGADPLYLLPGAGQLAGRENGTVDGVHPTDLGFLRMAEAYQPLLARVLAEHADTPE